MATFAKRSIGYLLLLVAVGIVFAWYVQEEMHLDHLESIERLEAMEELRGVQLFSPDYRAAQKDAYGEPSVLMYGLAALGVGVAGLAVLEPGVRRVLVPERSKTSVPTA